MIQKQNPHTTAEVAGYLQPALRGRVLGGI